jgi:hypothetical protein
MSAACTKAFTLHITNTDCPDWESVDWLANLNTAANGAGTFTSDFTPQSGGAGFDVFASAPDSLAGDGAALLSGPTLLNFAAGPCNCTLHAVVTKVGSDPLNIGGTIWMFDNIAHTFFNIAATTLPLGVTVIDIPFTTFAGMAFFTIFVGVQVAASYGEPTPISIRIQGYIKNV